MANLTLSPTYLQLQDDPEVDDYGWKEQL